MTVKKFVTGSAVLTLGLFLVAGTSVAQSTTTAPKSRSTQPQASGVTGPSSTRDQDVQVHESDAAASITREPREVHARDAVPTDRGNLRYRSGLRVHQAP